MTFKNHEAYFPQLYFSYFFIRFSKNFCIVNTLMPFLFALKFFLISFTLLLQKLQ